MNCEFVFFEQRRWRHMGRDAKEGDLNRVLQLYRTMRNRWSEVEAKGSTF
jgi:hypothetical protein